MNSQCQIDQIEPMTLDNVWALIDVARNGATKDDANDANELENGFIEIETVISSLEDEISHLSTTEICQFYLGATQLEGTDIGTAYRILGDHDEFGHQYTLAWLIYQGRTTFESVTANPEPAMRALAAANWVAGEISSLSGLASTKFTDRTDKSLI